MAINTGRQKLFLQPMRWGSLHPVSPGFLFFWGEGGALDFLGFFLCSHQVPNGFLTCFSGSQCVPLHVLNTSHFIHIFCLKFYSLHLHKQSKQGYYNISIGGLSKTWFITLYKEEKKKELWGSPQPINMHHNILPYYIEQWLLTLIAYYGGSQNNLKMCP
jgi:hypothetical protein